MLHSFRSSLGHGIALESRPFGRSVRHGGYDVITNSSSRVGHRAVPRRDSGRPLVDSHRPGLTPAHALGRSAVPRRRPSSSFCREPSLPVTRIP